MTFKKVLVLGAHPDDEVGCAGTISRLVREEANVTLLTFSDCQDLNDHNLLSEWANAAHDLGVFPMTIQNIPNRRFPEYRQKILDRLDMERGKYDLVLCPSINDIHQDHNTVAQEARRVFKGAVLLGYELAPNQVALTDNRCYVKLDGADMVAKLNHAKAYKTQYREPYMDAEYLTGLARVRGVQAESTYAEAFEVIRWVL